LLVVDPRCYNQRMTIAEFQKRIEAIYLERDSARGVDGTFRWFVEEVGELAKAARGVAARAPGARDNLSEEFADVLAWLATLASLTGVDLEEAARRKYEEGCPKCRSTPCVCPSTH
jgi:NTP pyrophosphatase (non-canonical NTP hydrolase)